MRSSTGNREEGSGRWLTYRSITRGHFRRQHYKDENGVDQVRRKWIFPYERGPAGAPFYQPARVTTLAR